MYFHNIFISPQRNLIPISTHSLQSLATANQLSVTIAMTILGFYISRSHDMWHFVASFT